MKKIWGFLLVLGVLCLQNVGFANSVNLFNDSPTALRAVICAADGSQLGEFVLNSRDATEWSDDYENAGVESSSASQVPYTVYWYCMGGAAYGTCNDVSAGAVVTAQSCQGAQECSQSSQQEE